MAKKKATQVDELELEDDFEVEDEEEAAATPKSKKKAAPKGVGARQVADHIGVDPKTFRAWLRRMLAAEELEMDHEHKGRYNFGNSINSPQVKKVVKLWNASSHERGRPKKDDDSEDEAE